MKVRARDIATRALNVHTFAVASLGNVKSLEAAHKPIGAHTTQIHTESVQRLRLHRIQAEYQRQDSHSNQH